MDGSIQASRDRLHHRRRMLVERERVRRDGDELQRPLLRGIVHAAAGLHLERARRLPRRSGRVRDAVRGSLRLAARVHVPVIALRRKLGVTREVV